MMVIEKDRAQLKAGFRCDACRAPIPPSTLYRVTCPACHQTFTAPPLPAPAHQPAQDAK